MKAHLPPQTGDNDIYSGFKWNPTDAALAHQILKREATPEAITYFAEHCDTLTDYAYWFFLSTLWVSYTGHSDLELWKRLFSAMRQGRERCLMKPSEYKEFRSSLRPMVTAYRAHRPGETDWIAYTRSVEIAQRFARERGSPEISVYEIPRRYVLALFLRRGEHEIIVLDKSNAQYTGFIPLIPLKGVDD